MAGNVGFDWLLGLIPFVGAIPDFFFRSNTRNLRIIKRHLDKHHAGTATIEAQASPIAALRALPRSRRAVSAHGSSKKGLCGTLIFCFSRRLPKNGVANMYKTLVALAILSVASAPVAAQTAPTQSTDGGQAANGQEARLR